MITFKDIQNAERTMMNLRLGSLRTWGTIYCMSCEKNPRIVFVGDGMRCPACHKNNIVRNKYEAYVKLDNFLKRAAKERGVSVLSLLTEARKRCRKAYIARKKKLRLRKYAAISSMMNDKYLQLTLKPSEMLHLLKRE